MGRGVVCFAGLPLRVADPGWIAGRAGRAARRLGSAPRSAVSVGAPDGREPVGVEAVVAAPGGGDDDVVEDGGDDRVLPG